MFSRERSQILFSGRCGRRIEDTPKTESRRCWFRWRGDLFNREEKSDSGGLGDGGTVCAWFIFFLRSRGQWFERVIRFCNKVICLRCGGSPGVRS